MELNEILSRRIKQLLTDLHYTQYELFVRSAVSCSSISMILSCKVNDVHLSTILNICRGLNIKLSEFFDSELFDFENISDNEQ